MNSILHATRSFFPPKFSSVTLSWQSQGFWATKGSDCLNGREMPYRIDPKRPPQRVVDGSGVELVPNKKQAVEASTNNSPYSGMLNSNVPQWGSAPSFHSYPSHFADRCYEYEGAIAKTMGFDDKRFSLMGADKLSLGRKVNDNPFGNESSFNLSMTHTLEDPQSALTYGGGGFRKIKVSEVKDSENYVTGSMGHGYSGENNTTLLPAPAYSKVDDNSTLTGLSYNKGEENIIPIGDTYESAFNNFVSMGQSFDKGEGIITTGQTYKETMLPGQTFNKGNNDTVYLSQTYKSGENSVSAGLVHDKTPETAVTSCAFNKSDKSILSICQSYDKGESTMISFGGYDDDYEVNASERLIPNDELLMGIASALKTEAINETEFINSTADALVNAHHIAASATKSFSKKKDDHKISKKVPSNNFPPNVRSLLSTGMLDGVPVKYIAWSREVILCSHAFIF